MKLSAEESAMCIKGLRLAARAERLAGDHDQAQEYEELRHDLTGRHSLHYPYDRSLEDQYLEA